VTVPFPEPLAPAVTVSHVSLLVAVHAHPVAAVTVTEAVTPAAAALADGAEIVGAQGAAAWSTVKALPPMVIVADRGVLAGFAVTL
jgi:hypothetical protein